MTRIFFVLLTAITVTGCVATAPITQPPVTMRFSSAESRANVTGLDSVIIRTRLRQGDTSAELASVPCRLNGPGFEARFTTPAILELPILDNAAPQVALSCRFDGETKSTTLVATNISEEERREAREDALDDLEDGDASARLVLLLNLRSRRGPDTFRYPDRTLTFRR